MGELVNKFFADLMEEKIRGAEEKVKAEMRAEVRAEGEQRESSAWRIFIKRCCGMEGQRNICGQLRKWRIGSSCMRSIKFD